MDKLAFENEVVKGGNQFTSSWPLSLLKLLKDGF
jgi:hypothetical protein